MSLLKKRKKHEKNIYLLLQILQEMKQILEKELASSIVCLRFKFSNRSKNSSKSRY